MVVQYYALTPNIIGRRLFSIQVQCASENLVDCKPFKSKIQVTHFLMKMNCRAEQCFLKTISLWTNKIFYKLCDRRRLEINSMLSVANLSMCLWNLSLICVCYCYPCNGQFCLFHPWSHVHYIMTLLRGIIERIGLEEVPKCLTK